MDFSVKDLLDEQQSQQWLEEHFHPDGLHSPRCQASREEALSISPDLGDFWKRISHL